MLWQALPTTLPYTHFYFPLFLSCQQPWPQKPVSFRHLNIEEARGSRTRPVCCCSAHNIPFCGALEFLRAAGWHHQWKWQDGVEMSRINSSAFVCSWWREGRGWAQTTDSRLYFWKIQKCILAGKIFWFVKWLFSSFLTFSYLFLNFFLIQLFEQTWDVIIQTIITTNYRDLTHICINSVSKINVLFPWCFHKEGSLNMNRAVLGQTAPAPCKPRPGLRQWPEQMQSKQQITNTKIMPSHFLTFFFLSKIYIYFRERHLILYLK